MKGSQDFPKTDQHRPQEEDFSAGAVQKAIWGEVLQHPATLFPGALAILSTAYMGLISLDKTAFALALGGALASLGSVVFNYFFRGETLAQEHVAKLLLQRNQMKNQAFHEMEGHFRETDFENGLEAVRELHEAYVKLQSLLSEKQAQRAAKGSRRFVVLADDCYREGLKLLTEAGEYHGVLRGVDRDKLAREKRAWEAKVADLSLRAQGPGNLNAQLKAAQTRMETYQKRVELFDKRQAALESLLAQCELLESALESAYLEVVDLVGGRMSMTGSDPAEKLEMAVNAARRVEDRLRGMEEPNPEDELYREAGRRVGG